MTFQSIQERIHEANENRNNDDSHFLRSKKAVFLSKERQKCVIFIIFFPLRDPSAKTLNNDAVPPGSILF